MSYVFHEFLLYQTYFCCPNTSSSLFLVLPLCHFLFCPNVSFSSFPLWPSSIFSLLSCLYFFFLILSCRFITYIQVFAVLCSSFAFSFCHCVPVVFWCPLLILFFISCLVISVLFNDFGYYFNIIPYLYVYSFGAPCVVWLLFYVWCLFCVLNQQSVLMFVGLLFLITLFSFILNRNVSTCCFSDFVTLKFNMIYSGSAQTSK